MNNKIKRITECAERLSRENFLAENDYIASRIDDSEMYITKRPLGELTEDGIVAEIYEDGTEIAAAIFDNTDVGAAIYAHPAKCCVVARSGRTVPAILDDMAQIVGYKCRVVKCRPADIISGLRGSSAVLIEGGGALTTGRTLDEAFTCMTVLEKTAGVMVAGSVLGGCSEIGFLDAEIMRFIYKIKYSRQNQKNKAAEEI